jgi:hypothetical protein
MIAILALTGCAGRATPAPFDILVRGPAAQCSIEVAGRAVPYTELLEIARPQAKPGRSARILLHTNEVPYRCIGGAIYSLQLAGFEEVTVLDAQFRPLK